MTQTPLAGLVFERLDPGALPYRHTQRHTACPRRGDGHDADGIPGDCTRAAVATLLGLPDDLAVPHSVMASEGRWWPTLQLWLREHHQLDLLVAWRHPEARGRGAVGIVDDPTDVDERDRFELQEWGRYWYDLRGACLLMGGSPRGPFGHLLVGTLDGDVLHDPHPSRAGLTYASCAAIVVPAMMTVGFPVWRLALPAGAARA